MINISRFIIIIIIISVYSIANQIIIGEVVHVNDTTVRIKVSNTINILSGDKVHLYHKTSLGDEVQVGECKVSSVDNKIVYATPVDIHIPPTVGMVAKIIIFPKKDKVKAMSQDHHSANMSDATKAEAKKVFWDDVAKISKMKGDSTAGEATFALCESCHYEGGVNMDGIIPPVLDHAGTLYDKNHLIALIKDPAIALNVDHKYVDTMMHPMGSIKVMLTDDQQIANVVAYIMAHLVSKDKDIDKKISIKSQQYVDKAKKMADDLYKNSKEYSKEKTKHLWNEVIENIQKAISMGNAEAYWALALIYEDGYGDTKRDLGKMIENIIKSAEEGYAEAQYALGEMYEDGDEVVKDKGRAIYWYREAAKQGHQEAMRALEELFKKQEEEIPLQKRGKESKNFGIPDMNDLFDLGK